MLVLASASPSSTFDGETIAIMAKVIVIKFPDSSKHNQSINVTILRNGNKLWLPLDELNSHCECQLREKENGQAQTETRVVPLPWFL